MLMMEFYPFSGSSCRGKVCHRNSLLNEEIIRNRSQTYCKHTQILNLGTPKLSLFLHNHLSMTLIGILHWHGKIRNQFHFTGQKDTTSSLILIHCHSLFLSLSFRSEAMQEDDTVKYGMAQNFAHHPHALCDKSPGFKAISCIQSTTQNIFLHSLYPTVAYT